MGNTSDQSVCDFANRKLPVFASPFLDLGATYVDAMPVLWDGNGVHPPTIQNATGCTQQDSRFWWSVSDFGSSAPDGSYSSSLGDFSNKKFECPEVTSRQDINYPQIYMHGCSKGFVCQAHSQPGHSRSHGHQSEGLLDWLLWVPLEQIHRVLSEKTPQCIWGRLPVLQQIPPVFVSSWLLCTVHYNISSDLHSICASTLEIWAS